MYADPQRRDQPGRALQWKTIPIRNAGLAYNPPLNPSNPASTETNTMIVRKNNAGQWLDDNNQDWSAIVSGGAGVRMAGWDMPDRDVAIIATSNNAVSYKSTLGNILMAMSVRPGSGELFVVGTDATNEEPLRAEPEREIPARECVALRTAFRRGHHHRPEPADQLHHPHLRASRA